MLIGSVQQTNLFLMISYNVKLWIFFLKYCCRRAGFLPNAEETKSHNRNYETRIPLFRNCKVKRAVSSICYFEPVEKHIDLNVKSSWCSDDNRTLI